MSDNQSNSNITPPLKPVLGGKIRESNIELLRIISMFLVMVAHVTLAIEYPNMKGATELEYYLVGLMKAISVVSVNVFVMISGWFGIRFSYKRLFAFLFQVLFFSLVGYLIAILLGVKSFNIPELMTDGLLLGSRNYWFVESYLLLFLLSPVLNNFCEKSSRKQLKKFLVTAFTVEFVAAWLFPTLSIEIRAGYSVFSFTLIYMLSRYIQMYQPSWACFKAKYDVGIYLVLTLCLSGVAFVSHGGIVGIVGFYSYASPFVVAAALYLLLAFTKISFKSKIINFVASSCFAVYLLHEHVSIGKPVFRSVVKELYVSDTPFVSNVIDVLGYMLLVYSISIVIDQVRLKLSNCIILK